MYYKIINNKWYSEITGKKFGMLGLMYESNDEYDTILKHGDYFKVLEYNQEIIDYYEELGIETAIICLISIPPIKQFETMINDCINISLTKRPTKLKDSILTFPAQN